MDIKFAQAQLPDLEYLVDKTLLLQSFESTQQHFNDRLSPDLGTAIADWLEIELTSPTTIIFLIKSSNITVGFAHIRINRTPNSFTLDNSFGVIQSLWIDKEYRRNAIGKSVVEFIENIFREQNCDYYEASYTSSNSNAAEFWSSVGLAPYSTTARKRLNN